MNQFLTKHNTCRMIAFVVFCMTVASHAETNRVTIFVSAPTRDGFIDTSKEIQDSVKDVRSRLSHIKQFQVVEKRDGAEIIVTVVARGIGSTTYGQRVTYSQYYGTAILASAPMVANTYWVSSVMDVGVYRKEFLGSYTQEASTTSMGAWGLCAEQIAKNLKAWAEANKEQLSQKR
jgi:hypothetical protein